MKRLQRYPFSFRLYILFLFAFMSFGQVFGQAVKELAWKTSWSKPEINIGDEVEIILKATLIPGTYTYSNDFDPNLGPQLTELELEKHASYQVIGKLRGIGAKKKYEEVWPGEVSIFTKTAEFRIKVKILSKNPAVKGILTSQVCNESTCVTFFPEITLPTLKVNDAAVGSTVDINPPVKIGSDSTASTIDTTNPMAVDVPSVAGDNPPTAESQSPATETEEIADDDIRNKSLLSLFLLGFAAGFLAILTPCVFPMIPMTVAFFTKRQEKAKGRKMALFYGFSIIAIYTGIGLLLSALMGAAFGYTLSTHWFPNLLFFTIFMIFGASFLGAFELVLPSSLVNSIDKKSDKGGYLGVFFIALTLVVISFSCTAPVVGSVAILAEDGELLRPFAAMLGFSLSFALPFTFFAFFPQWLNSLPKSGGWLNSVKVVFGFVEVALALKFFSQADLAYHWGILDRDVFLSFWIILSILLGFYLFGKLKFSHDSDVKHVSVPRFFMGLIAFSFAIYMIPGLFGAPLKPLAGILPPLSAQEWVIGDKKVVNDTVKYADKLRLPHGLKGFFDYKQGLNAVRTLGKPALLDFTGHSCASCRRMEENVWPVPGVMSKLQNDVIIISLYADEKLVLPENEWYTSARDGRVKKTLGDQNMDLEISKYNENAQPMYFIVDEEGKALSKFNGYKNDPEEYIAFIEKGVKLFYENKKAKK